MHSLPATASRNKDICLYFPVAVSTASPSLSNDLELANSIEAFLCLRNVFAFLTRQILVASPLRPTYLAVFQAIIDFLRKNQFTNLDRTNFGELAASNFEFYIEELRLADVRNNAYKMAEALVLGEQMRSTTLYNEAFVHAVGKFDAVKELPGNLYQQVSAVTRNRIERAALDLDNRLKNTRERLADFDFPSIFTGIANSTSIDETKSVHFKTWKSAYAAMRKHVLNHYKDMYGSWPPKAGSRHNEFEKNGLNRIVLQLMYKDLSDLYDLLVDRTSLTSRSMDKPSDKDANEVLDPDETIPHALRRVMSEYDRSSPPVQPPIPFDTPIMPSLPSSGSTKHMFKPAKGRSKGLSPDDMHTALDASYNADAAKPTLFLSSFKAFERKAGQAHTIEDLCDQRNGHWIFLYAVLQALPLLVVDAPNLRWDRGVEYFLCEPPRGGMPWAKSDHTRNRSWYGIAGGSGVVSLPTDVVNHGIEGIYRRSHCWTVAQQWAGPEHSFSEPDGPPSEAPPARPMSSVSFSTAELPVISAPAADPTPINTPHVSSPLLGTVSGPSPATHERLVSQDRLGSPDLSASPSMAIDSPAGPRQLSSNRNSAVFLGLEALPIPAGVSPEGLGPPGAVSGRRLSVHDPSKSFEDIITQVEAEQKQEKEKALEKQSKRKK